MESKNNINICPIEFTLMMIGDKWKIIIIRELLTGVKRFNELQKNIGKISQRVLSYNLRDMEKNGLVIRKAYNQIPPKVEYKLTEKGKSLKLVLDEMARWGIEYKEK